MTQHNMLECLETPSVKSPKTTTGTFTDNMKLPVHRWFRYSAGFSAQWAERIILDHSKGGKTRVLDPFCGSGTTLIAAAKVGADSVGLDTHPFIARVASAKLNWHVDPDAVEAFAHRIKIRALELRSVEPCSESVLLAKCYSSENLSALESLKSAYFDLAHEEKNVAVAELSWLAITCILRECSGAGTAQWQYVLPNKTKSRVSDPYGAFSSRIEMFCNDLRYSSGAFTGTARVLDLDAREPLDDEPFDLVLTSPPYPNNYDYADATRLEMTFWGEVGSWGDLQGSVRKYLIRSCSQHSAAEKLQLPDLLESADIAQIRQELSAVCNELDEVRHSKGGKKTYHTMIAAYFSDLAKVWSSLRASVKPGGKVAFVIGDSAPYGVYVPCDEWLGQLALAAGFRSYEFHKLRDRNIKWKNRKHKVPLKEGILWVEG